ncbi:peroxiredoxin [Pseudomonas amygdali]|uniref:peroxiredoxin n=1 Tax=Pseudomonas amygdali TaxID=47877 RepID=UPI001FB6CF57|nr:peroxiredoxin [Pseudomonas amygdali]UPT36782.1 peroxiredoxin [Pseudomonas amygdali pv. loropetali]
MTLPDLFQLPPNLPKPVDDGAAAHLEGSRWPSLPLASTDGTNVDLSMRTGTHVVYAYPMTARPGIALPDGWDDIPGARGCTPQSCRFRDHYQELLDLGAGVFGLSGQPSSEQREAKDRLHLPYELLSDESLKLQQALQLPTFNVEGKELLKRITLIIEGGVIVKTFYPVFPPDRNADEVIAWLRATQKT